MMANLLTTLFIMDQKTYNTLIIGIVIWYLIRHFSQPKTGSIWSWIILWTVWIFALIVVYSNIKHHYDKIKKK